MKDGFEKQIIKEAFEAAVPDIKASVLEDCRKQTKRGKVIKMSDNTVKTNKRKPLWKAALAAAAALVLLVGAGFAVNRIAHKEAVPEAVVMIDVNPSIELTVGKEDRVLAARANNEDAVTVLEGMDLTGSSVNVAVNAVIGAMLRGGYLNELANSVLISVDSGSEEVCSRLRDVLSGDLKDLLESGFAVLSQTIDESDGSVGLLAEEYGVTLGKAQLISKLAQANPAYEPAALTALSINELGILSRSNAVTNLRAYGESSTGAYIGEENAERIALEYAGAADGEAENVRTELEFEHGRMVYEVEFVWNGSEYEVDVDAVTGEVVGCEQEPKDPKPTSAPAQPTDAPAETLISAAEALAAAYERAGITQSDAYDVETELERDDGRPVWSCEFKAKGREYECDIDAVTGEVLSFESEKLPSSKPTQAPAEPTQKPTQAPSGQEYIGRSAALKTALKDAGLEKSDVHDIDIERDTKNGVPVYEVDFEHGGWEYDYVINARTGEIIEKHRERGDGGSQGGSNDGVNFIGEAEAWRIALERAGLTESQIRGREIELDCDNGTYCYELEFRSGKYEYEVKINAVTGAVMKFERETDD